MEDDTFSKDEELLSRLNEMKDKYNLHNKKKAWLQYMTITNGDASMDFKLLEEDFNREVKFYAVAQENSKTMVDRLIKANIPVWRPNDFKAETFKLDEHMVKVQKHLEDIKNKIDIVGKRKEAKNKKKFGNEAHKRHVKSKQLKNNESKAKRQKQSKSKSVKYMRRRKKN
ncbi:hypothetical protein SteCoe_8140 [Stentor coeruleus]|uniref:Uncharacterized protein n=1 Tax=Stentor coeruleus TaxID=5963 RepID=A0A1R2CL05_9CILI|nr:hypothetical protein SteCoe_8140 [Stentor coeruleus]